VLAAVVLAVYSWTVYTQRRWSQEYTRLQVLERDERQLTAANEALKDNLAEQAGNADTHLLLPQANNMLFMAPAPERAAIPEASSKPPETPALNAPLGY
jgi:hypothetical protein